MNTSPLTMSGFELVDTPGSLSKSCLSLDQFEDPSPMKHTFCQQITEDEYENQGSETTQLALKALIEDLEKDPTKFQALLQRRRLDELENSGLVSFLKCRFLSSLKGDNYKKTLLSEEECQDRLDEVKTGMLMAFNYSQQSKGHRFSQRLAARRARLQQQQLKVNDENTPVRGAAVPRAPPLPPHVPMGSGPGLAPPPPPCPPPMLRPLRDSNIMCSTPRSPKHLKRPALPKRESMAKLTIHQELLATSPLKRLKVTQQIKSPGGTPQKKKSRFGGSTDSLNWNSPGMNSSEPLTSAFLRIMEHKFRNVRTPSPGLDRSAGSLLSPHSFSDASP